MLARQDYTNIAPQRKEILKLFMDKVKLTEAGANTYCALIKKKTDEKKSCAVANIPITRC